ncbi:hypothetical protein [Sanyastnella coralliicola]|uniref:hypothetical protein n=1 Tax=Sanyastnella coralliicola TaxID=3069118 RepID=UPI0027B9C932|nr:hypothetical protein [Longitalea sp. SCSIO 12813]
MKKAVLAVLVVLSFGSCLMRKVVDVSKSKIVEMVYPEDKISPPKTSQSTLIIPSSGDGMGMEIFQSSAFSYGHFKNNLKAGEWITIDENQRIVMKEYFKDGMRHNYLTVDSLGNETRFYVGPSF